MSGWVVAINDECVVGFKEEFIINVVVGIVEVWVIDEFVFSLLDCWNWEFVVDVLIEDNVVKLLMKF